MDDGEEYDELVAVGPEVTGMGVRMGVGARLCMSRDPAPTVAPAMLGRDGALLSMRVFTGRGLGRTTTMRNERVNQERLEV